MAKDKKVSKALLIFVSILSLLIGFVLGGTIKFYLDKPTSDKIISGDLKIHFLELGNEYVGDCILIQVGETDVLIDAGSKTSSLETIKTYLDNNMNDNILEYVIVTHAHEDHYANFAGDGNTSLFTYYQTKNIIQFAKTNQKNGKMYQNYLTMVEKERADGANVYTALECYNNEKGCNREIDLGHEVELEILYNYYYENTFSGDENNYSVCVMINHGDQHFLFTGDLEEIGEEKLVEYNNLPKVSVFKAGHHGSNTSNGKTLLNAIEPEIVIITTVAGTVEYTQKLDNTFPTTNVLNNISLHTDKVYVTSKANVSHNGDKYVIDNVESLNGNILLTSNKNGLTITGSNHSDILKNTDWYINNRNNIYNWK